MQVSKKLEQQIAVFGESGSGKTVLLSSFYGATQEPQYIRSQPFNVIADDIGQGSRLHRNYLGMRDSGRLPGATRFAATSYAFSVKMQDQADSKANRSRPFDALRIVWHDYPGEWFEQGVSGEEESHRRVDTFRSLLGSDIALLLVDGQRLVDHRGEEERYLKSMLGNFRNALLTLKDELLVDGKGLVEFPRIWILALSKSDLLPDMTVFQFRDLLVEKACDELDELRKVLASLLEGAEALSFGEDFVLLSSAKFEPGGIEVSERVGVELILPLAAILPFERHVWWSQTKQLPSRVAERLSAGAGNVAAGLVGRKQKAGLGLLLGLLGPDVVREAAKLAGDGLQELNAQARARHDRLSETLTRFKMDLNEGEIDQVLLRSRR